QYRMTLFLTTHYMEEADTLCDRIAIIDDGHIVKTGTPEELKASVGGDVITVTVKEKEPDLSPEIAQIGLVKDVKKIDGAYRIKTELREDGTPQVKDLTQSKGRH